MMTARQMTSWMLVMMIQITFRVKRKMKKIVIQNLRTC